MPSQYKVLHKYGNKNTNREIKETVFRNQKSAYQFEQRSKKGWEVLLSNYDRPITRMIKKEGCDNWEQYTVIGNKLVTVSELEYILKLLSDEAQELQHTK
jgi:hypothetical protein